MANVDIILSGFTPSEREYSNYGDNEPIYVYTFNGFDLNGNSLDLSIDKGTYNIQGSENGPVLLGYSKAAIGSQIIDVSDFNNYGDNNSGDGIPPLGAASSSNSSADLTSYYGMLQYTLNGSDYLLKIVRLVYNTEDEYTILYLVDNDSSYRGYIGPDGTIEIENESGSSAPSEVTDWVIIFGDNVFTDSAMANNYFSKFSNGSSPQYDG